MARLATSLEPNIIHMPYHERQRFSNQEYIVTTEPPSESIRNGSSKDHKTMVLAMRAEKELTPHAESAGGNLKQTQWAPGRRRPGDEASEARLRHQRRTVAEQNWAEEWTVKDWEQWHKGRQVTMEADTSKYRDSSSCPDKRWTN